MNANKMMEVWFNLMTEVMKGNSDAQETVRSITGTSMRPDEMLRIMSRFMPAGMGPLSGESLNDWLEEYWKTMGVVPRYRYLELLERYDQLRVKLEESEKTVRTLQPMLGVASQQEEAKKVLDVWGNMLQETIKAQSDLMHNWSTMFLPTPADSAETTAPAARAELAEKPEADKTEAEKAEAEKARRTRKSGK